ncbi:hypothetical protein THASP1DRAFT_28455 [Thamnocephalis sphaerospora]|uniref:Stress-associated endoplasmic reticulum protein n=1 Tax=Thamnocephalis sphaerospora TaxID=78915 RepID=A0A4P9XU62_9FUNG|nr:hypothetical protein THASP1DRAFT_28455 [Thamnocephalis sphaerospora]|eukprot:RKP09743.1 hypothetical protein THASP1DRAFT_28455 [Thamnocephalis sphaerospora]
MSATHTMRQRNAAYAKNIHKRGTAAVATEKQPKSTLSTTTIALLLFVVLALFQLFNLI